ncbi:tyrosine-type recombinase/integrase [Streptomyces chitinivorans]|uniref:Tyrosine-type recombinase/integrase n=1 Tax=Streptomyces chitinivorans TaxID=1257027 RepID=A0ABW7HMJ2_9ACTN|nr:site-specific integrase [Streptomyces chitinivorans]MDH2410840.1 site-specific integrase [Streptomyces chitinivorans]
MVAVVDLWHADKPKTPRDKCAEHRKFPTPLHGKGKRWQVRYRTPNGQQRKASWAKRVDADRHAAQLTATADRARLGLPGTGKETFGEVAHDWAATAHHRQATAERTERVLRLHILPVFGTTPIRSITRKDVQRWVADFSAHSAPRTVESTYAVLRAVFSEAEREGIIDRSPCTRIRLPAPDGRRTPPPTPEQVAALAAAAPDHYRAVVWLAAGAGLRWGEIFGLEADAVDLDAGTVTVRQQLANPTAGFPYLALPKTAMALRTVPLPGVTVEALRAHLRRFPPRAVQVDDRIDVRRPRRRTAVLVFVSREGEPLRHSNWARRWAKIVERANARLAESIAPGTTLHTLRHGYVSTLVQAGVSIKAVQTYAGHSNPGVTLKVYAHVLPGADDTARAAVQSTLGAVPSVRPQDPPQGEMPGQKGQVSNRTSNGHRRRTAPRTPACPVPRRRSAAAGREAGAVP